MKCRLVQILAVAMLLGHTVSMFSLKFRKLEPKLTSIPEKLEPKLTSTFNELEHKLESIFKELRYKHTTNKHVTSISKRAISAKNNEARLVEAAHIKISNAIAKLANYEYIVQFDSKYATQPYAIVDRLLNLREILAKSKKDKQIKMVNDIDNDIYRFKAQLETTQQDIKTYIKKKNVERMEITEKIVKLEPNLLRDINRPLKHAQSKTSVDSKNTNKILHKQIKALIKKEEILYNDIKYAHKISYRMHRLLRHINRNGYRKQTEHDTRDTQSMRNVIGISIAVCAIVTLCIVLLIAVRNKHRTNAEVRLFERV